MTDSEDQLTRACIAQAEKRGHVFNRRVRIVKGSRRYCPKSHSDVFARTNSTWSIHPQTGERLKPVVYVHESCWLRVVDECKGTIEPLLHLISRIEQVVHDVDHYPFLAIAIGRNVEAGDLQ